MGAAPVFVDGQACDEAWTLDRSLQYGDGLFETMRVRDGRIRFLALHQARLAEGCRRLAIQADLAAFWRHAEELARQQLQCLLKLQVSRGNAVARGYAPAGTETARTILWVHPAPDAREIPASVQVVSLDAYLGENPALAGLKHCNRLEQVLGRRALAPTGAFEGLMASSSGRLISGTMSNVFIELDGELVTPGLERCGVAGVLRAVVLREAARAGLRVGVADVPWEARARCSGMALSNARMGLLPVQRLDGRDLAPSAGLARLAAVVESLDA